MLPSWLLKPFVAPLLGVLALVSLGTNIYQFFSARSTISDLRDKNTTLTSENANLTRDNATLRVNNTTLQAGIATQNNAVEGLRTAGELATANANAARATAEAAAAATRAQREAALKAAQPGADPCVSASTLIRDTLAGEHSR
jgi:hypothetical protein